jgi:ribosome biogenesis protein UTP30
MALTTHKSKVSGDQTPYQLDPVQTLKASQALLNHLRKETQRLQDSATKQDLLKVDNESDEGDRDIGNDTSIWLSLTTKQHIVDKNRLKPSKITVPHSLNTSPNLNICIISADPQRALKNVVADDSFPADLSSRITRIIGLTKLKSRYKSFEQRRALRDEHDIFLADDRIVSRLPDALGKVFYKSTTKRPIPIRISEQDKVDGKRVKRSKDKKKGAEDKFAEVAAPSVVAKEITRSLNAIPVTLKPGVNLAVRAGLGSFTAEQLAGNVTALVAGIVEKHVVKGWRNVRSIHIKAPTTTALPIWLADELWVEDTQVEGSESGAPAVEEAVSLKRKRNPSSTKGPQAGQRKKSRSLGNENAGGRNGRLAAEKDKAFSNAAKAVMV